MHELALCGAIAGIVDERAGGREVRVVRVRIGALRQVVPDTLTYCWAIVVGSTPLAGARLEVERVAARLRCDRCAVEHDLGPDLDLGCPACGSSTVSVLSGEEFLVASIDVAAVEVAG